MRKIFQSDTSIRIISVLISILLWMYVVGVNNPSVSVVLRGIPVQIVNNEQFDEAELKVISVSHKAVDVKIEGRHSEVSKISAADIEASVDVSQITEAGTYDLDIVINSTDSGVRYTNITSNKTKIFADSVIAVNKDVTVVTEGVPKENSNVKAATSADAKILIRGPKSVVDTVNLVGAYVNIDGADSDFSKSCSLKITDKIGREVDMTYVTTNITETVVDVKFTQTKEVEINPIIGNADFLSDYDIKISPEKINITGDALIVKSLSKIDTKQIDIQEADLPDEGESKTLTAALDLPESILIADEDVKDIELVVTPKVR